MYRQIGFLIMLMLASVSMRAQYGSFGVTDARSLGMGNTYTATSFDLYAIGKNPGLLSSRDGNYKLSIIFPNLTAQQYGLSDALSTFDYYTANKLRSDGLLTLNKEKFAIALDNNGKLFLDGLIGFFSLAYHPGDHIGSFAFSMSDYLTSFMDIPDIILEVNYGSEIPDGNFSLDNFSFKSWWIRTYALSYSRYIIKNNHNIYSDGPAFLKSLSGGITLKYVATYAYTDIGLSADVNYSTATQTLSGSYDATAVYSFSQDLQPLNAFTNQDGAPRGFLNLHPAGKGFGIDLGAGAELQNGFILGLALTDLGSISWSGAATESEFEGYIDISGVIQYEDIDSLSHNISLVSERSNTFNTPLPAALRLGVALKFQDMFHSFPGELLAGIDYNQGLNNQPSNYTNPRFSFGMEYRYKPTWPILIGGYTYDFLGISRGAIGLGYKTYFMDVYVSTIDVLSISGETNRFSASLVARWKFFSGEAKKRGPECY